VSGGGRAWLRRRFVEPEPPAAAIEVRGRGVSALRLERRGGRTELAAAAAFELEASALRLSLHEPNLLQPDAFAHVLELLCDRVGLTAGTPVALVLPDAVARVAFVPAAELRARGRAETEEQLRFHLRKALPFDAREARLAWKEVPGVVGRPAQLLVAAIYGPVLAGYEDALRTFGLRPGLVELAGLALLRALPPGEGDELLVNWDAGYVSLALLRGGEPVLFRTLAGELAGEPAEVAREAANTVLYYRERLGGPGLQRASVRSAARPLAEAAELLRDPLGLLPQPIDPWASLPGAPQQLEAQRFAGAVASLRAEAA
jgi:hypothetical protein